MVGGNSSNVNLKSGGGQPTLQPLLQEGQHGSDRTSPGVLVVPTIQRNIRVCIRLSVHVFVFTAILPLTVFYSINLSLIYLTSNKQYNVFIVIKLMKEIRFGLFSRDFGVCVSKLTRVQYQFTLLGSFSV